MCLRLPTELATGAVFVRVLLILHHLLVGCASWLREISGSCSHSFSFVNVIEIVIGDCVSSAAPFICFHLL